MINAVLQFLQMCRNIRIKFLSWAERGGRERETDTETHRERQTDRQNERTNEFFILA